MMAVVVAVAAVSTSGLSAAAADERGAPAPGSEWPVFAFEFGHGLVTGNISTLYDVAFGPGGIIAVADLDNGHVLVFHANGTLAYWVGSYGQGPGGLDEPAGVAFGPGGILAVADRLNDHVHVFHANGTFAYQVGSEGSV